MKASLSITSVIVVFVVIYLLDSISSDISAARNDEVTIHVLSCDDIDNQKSSTYNCKPEFLNTHTVTFRADYAHQTVTKMRYIGPETLKNCTVLDRQNWRCDDRRTDYTLITEMMTGGHYEYMDSANFGGLRIMQIGAIQDSIRGMIKLARTL